MVAMPEPIREAWDRRNGPAILTTVSRDGVPNSIYVTCVARFDDETLLVADNYFDKTRANLSAGTPAALLFHADDGKAYQVKGALERHTDGPFFDHMKGWNPPKHPGHAVAVLRIEAIFSGSVRIA